MIVHDFKCDGGHVSTHYVKTGVAEVPCPECNNPAVRVFLSAPKLDWLGMAQGESAGPEFIDRFEKVHKEEADKERKHMERNGDYGPGKPPPPAIVE